jgi:hypothetical protein
MRLFAKGQHLAVWFNRADGTQTVQLPEVAGAGWHMTLCSHPDVAPVFEPVAPQAELPGRSVTVFEGRRVEAQ